MPSHEGATTKLEAPVKTHRRTTALTVAWWRHIALEVAYVLVAGPRGLLYALVLMVGLALDLPYLAARIAVGGGFRLLYTLARALLWLLRFGLHYLWVGTSVVVGVVSTVFGSIVHPRRAWQRAFHRTRHEQERVPLWRRRSMASMWSGTRSFRARGDRFYDTSAASLKRWRRHIVPDHWIFVPVLWWRLAVWEHSHTMRWLDVALPTLEPPRYTLVQRRTVVSYPPLMSLAYMLAKVPLGVVALGVVVLVMAMSAWLIDSHNDGAVIVMPLLGVMMLHVLAQGSARFAQRAFSPSEATRRLQAAEALAAQERAKAERAELSRRDLIINVGHELRTPTASILGHVESVLLALDSPKGQIEPETLRNYLAIVQREAERLSSLVDDLLAVARAERSELHLRCAPLDAATVIHEVYEALAPLARRERQVLLIYEVQQGLPPMLADRQRLSQVLLNLVRNAVTYTSTGGIVSMTLRRLDDQRLILTVADTGSGIAPAELERVFERFYRADQSRARSSGGFGLGLAIARDLVEAMGGTITAESTLGEGSSFHVTLPIASDDTCQTTA
jgi:two-component system, OmpR family, phosphate regulon sensor histidine kinase PhoR